MKVLVRILFFIIYITFINVGGSLFGQDKQTYKSNGTIYIYGETYSTTGKPKVERSSSAKSEFLKSKGYDKVPYGYQVDHIVPLSEGGADKPSNMQLITIDQHKYSIHDRYPNKYLNLNNIAIQELSL